MPPTPGRGPSVTWAWRRRHHPLPPETGGGNPPGADGLGVKKERGRGRATYEAAVRLGVSTVHGCQGHSAVFVLADRKMFEQHILCPEKGRCPQQAFPQWTGPLRPMPAFARGFGYPHIQHRQQFRRRPFPWADVGHQSKDFLGYWVGLDRYLNDHPIARRSRTNSPSGLRRSSLDRRRRRDHVIRSALAGL